MSKRTYTNKDFVVKDIWDQRAFSKTDGSTGTVQKILNEDDKSLVIWDHKADMKDILQVGKKYHAKGVTIKQNQDGYDEYHTGQYSVITPLKSRANEEFFHEVTQETGKQAFNASVPERLKPLVGIIPDPDAVPKDLHDTINQVNNRLIFIIEQLGYITAQIELLEKKI